MALAEKAPAPVEYDDKAVPKLLSITSAAFKAKYNQWASFHDEVLPPEQKQEKRGTTKTGPNTHKEFLEGFDDSSDMHQHLVNELITMLREFEKEDDEVNGDTIWRHQKALLIEFIQMLVQKRRSNAELKSFLMEEAPGTGKTRIMGIIIAALSRMMVRGVMTGNVLILVKRKSMVMQQALSKDGMRSAVLSKESSKMRTKEIEEQRRFALQEFTGAEQDFFPKKEWASICDENPTDVDAARQLIQESLTERKLWDDFVLYPQHERVLDELAHCVARQGGVVFAPNGSDLEFLELSPASEEEGSGRGDLLFGVDRQIFDTGGVFMQSSYDVGNEQAGSLPTRNSRIVVMAHTTTYQQRARESMKDCLANVEWIFLDEAGKVNPDTLGTMVTHDSIGGEKPAHVFGATAFRDGSNFHGNFSQFTVEDANNSPDQVLKPPRLVEFPGQEGVRFPSGSYEAAEQVITQVGKKIALAEKTGIPQPNEEGSMLVVVNANLVSYVVMRLRQEYGDTGMRFISYNVNSGDEEHTGRVQVRMNDPKYTQTCLVGSMDRVIDSFDWRQLRSTFMGVKETKATMEMMKRLYGRQYHSALENGYIFHQLLADEKERNRLPFRAYTPDAKIPDQGPISLVPGQYFVGKKACKAEEKTLPSTGLAMQKLWSDSTKAEFNNHVRKESRESKTTFPPKVRDNPLTNQSFVIKFPQVAKKVPAKQHAVGATYIREFAELNGLSEFEDELQVAVRKVEVSAQRAEALRTVALEYKLLEVIQKSTQAKASIRVAEREIKTQHPTRQQWEQYVQDETGKANSARVKVGDKKKKKKTAAPKSRSRPKAPARPPHEKHADKVIGDAAFADKARGTADSEFIATDNDMSEFDDDDGDGTKDEEEYGGGNFENDAYDDYEIDIRDFE
jgi:hypothetical protein